MNGLVLFTIAMVMATAFALTLAVYMTLTRTSDETRFDETLAIIQSSELDDIGADTHPEDEKKGFAWNRYWLKTAVHAGRVPDDPSSPGRFALGTFALGSFFGLVVWPGGIAGLAVGAGLLAAGAAWLNWEAGKRKALMESQMPILLSSLRSQMHAGVTVQAALMSVADNIPSPLGDEVRMVKRDVNVSISVESALDALADRVDSRQMQFLVSSIGIAVKKGADLVPQLVIIEQITQQRARIEGRIKSAVALARPTMLIAGAAPPLAFFYFALQDPLYITFFLTEGILEFAAAIAMYVGGLFIMRLLIRNVEKT